MRYVKTLNKLKYNIGTYNNIRLKKKVNVKTRLR